VNNLKVLENYKNRTTDGIFRIVPTDIFIIIHCTCRLFAFLHFNDRQKQFYVEILNVLKRLSFEPALNLTWYSEYPDFNGRSLLTKNPILARGAIQELR